jgi:hypothetical protein
MHASVHIRYLATRVQYASYNLTRAVNIEQGQLQLSLVGDLHTPLHSRTVCNLVVCSGCSILNILVLIVVDLS